MRVYLKYQMYTVKYRNAHVEVCHEFSCVFCCLCVGGSTSLRPPCSILMETMRWNQVSEVREMPIWRRTASRPSWSSAAARNGSVHKSTHVLYVTFPPEPSFNESRAIKSSEETLAVNRKHAAISSTVKVKQIYLAHEARPFSVRCVCPA